MAYFTVYFKFQFKTGKSTLLKMKCANTDVLLQFHLLVFLFFFVNQQTRQARYVVQLAAIVCYALRSKCIMYRQKPSKPPSSNTLQFCLFCTFFFLLQQQFLSSILICVIENVTSKTHCYYGSFFLIRCNCSVCGNVN